MAEDSAPHRLRRSEETALPGILKTSLPGAEKADLREAIRIAASSGLDALMATSLYDLSSSLDEAEIADLIAAARGQGVTLASGLGGFHPLRPERCANVVKAGDGDVVKGAARLARLAARTGLGDLFFAIGMITDREDPSLAWPDQLAAVREGLLKLAPALRELGTRVLVKTHEEITTFEILQLIEAVGEDVLGVAHDPVNVVCRMEEPVAATRRIAPYVRQVHIDDAVLQLDRDQVRRYLVPMGQGDLDWPAMLALTPNAKLWLETHRGQFAMACFDADWMRQQADANVEEYCYVAGSAVRRGDGPPPSDQSDPLGRVPSMQSWLASHLA
jgi:sugar phosphate isomerase/epimerase